MVSGYNHNVKYQGEVFHVQTEDSGLQNPHIKTHVFIGGTIVATERQSYAELVGREDLRAHLTELMQAQHKAVLKELIHGAYDGSIKALRGHAATLDGPAPINLPQGQARSSFARQSAPEPEPETQQMPPPRRVPPPIPVAADAARPAFAAPPPSANYVKPPAAPLAVPSRPIPPEEQGYAEAELIEADDQSVDSLFASLISEKTLDEVILSYLGQNKPKP
jgi:hypothetical protein